MQACVCTITIHVRNYIITLIHWSAIIISIIFVYQTVPELNFQDKLVLCITCKHKFI